MNMSRLFTGGLLVILGIVLMSMVFFEQNIYASLISGFILIVFGLVILLNSKEDKIEEIKLKSRRKK